MGNLFYNMMIFGIALQLSAYLVWASGVVSGVMQFPLGNYSDLMNLNNMFSLNLWSGLVGLAGVGIGLAALLLKSGTYAIYAVLLFAFGVFFNVVKGFVLAIPNLISALAVAAGLSSSVTSPIAIFVGVIVVFGGFIYLFELAIQRRAS